MTDLVESKRRQSETLHGEIEVEQKRLDELKIEIKQADDECSECLEETKTMQEQLGKRFSDSLR
jgi:hypothetical protein